MAAIAVSPQQSHAGDYLIEQAVLTVLLCCKDMAMLAYSMPQRIRPSSFWCSTLSRVHVIIAQMEVFTCSALLAQQLALPNTGISWFLAPSLGPM